MNKYTLILMFALFAVLPLCTFAGPIIRTGEIVSVDASQAVKGDFYGFGYKVIISGEGENDAYIGGGTVTVNAPIREDLSIVGGSVQVHGDVGDDVRIIGGDVIIGKPIKGDVVVVAGSLSILSTASIEGDIVFYGSELTVEGSVLGAIHGSAESVRIDSEVGGDVTLDVLSQFVLGSKAKTMGTITYESKSELVRAQDAVVTHEPRHTIPTRGEPESPYRMLAFEFLLIGFVALLLFVIARRSVISVLQTAVTRIGLSGLVGLGVIFVVPFVSMMLMVSVIGLLAGMLLFVAYTALLLCAIALAPIVLGYMLTFYGLKQESVTMTTILLGVLVWVCIGILPIGGALIMIVGIAITIGALSLTLYEHLRA